MNRALRMKSRQHDCARWQVSALQHGLLLIALTTIMGCNIESIWRVPYPPGEQPSPLWTADSRTQGWSGVRVDYALLTDRSVDAEVSSADHRHHFKVHGEFWYANEAGERCDNCRRFLVVRFGEREERYAFESRPDADRGLLLVIDSDHSGTTQPVAR